MAEPIQWVERFARVVDRWFDKLNEGNPGKPFRITTSPERRDLVFSVVSKPAAGGAVWPDGQRWHTNHGPDWYQAEVMTKTSPSDDELMRRLDMLVWKGVDSTQPVKQPQFTEDQINQMVNARVEQVLKQKLDEMQAAGPQRVGEVTAEPERLVPLPKGLQPRKVKNPERTPQDQIRLRKEKVDLWNHRANLMGFEPVEVGWNKWPKKSWLVRAEAAWAEYCKKGEPTVAGQP